MSWNIGRGIIRYIQHWHEFSSIYALYLACQRSQKEFSAGISLKYRVLTCRCKLTTTDLRNALKADIMEAIECLHSWMKSGVIKGLKRSVEDLTDDVLSEMEAEAAEYLSMMEK